MPGGCQTLRFADPLIPLVPSKSSTSTTWLGPKLQQPQRQQARQHRQVPQRQQVRQHQLLVSVHRQGVWVIGVPLKTEWLLVILDLLYSCSDAIHSISEKDATRAPVSSLYFRGLTLESYPDHSGETPRLGPKLSHFQSFCDSRLRIWL